MATWSRPRRRAPGSTGARCSSASTPDTTSHCSRPGSAGPTASTRAAWGPLLQLEQLLGHVVDQRGDDPEHDGRPHRLVLQGAVARLPVLDQRPDPAGVVEQEADANEGAEEDRSEEQTSELQSLTNLVCRLLLE